uniref:Uncharacterized protein n=1 Tax=uncultured marine group II/III euryarchaeote AD1000_86_F07 TaxID=1457816 RepID=A0A075G4H5_9EURY|nr:hypothetical protein [uncultured marine group II/III euryarchaeote AD1000_86_F07]
MQKRRTLWGAQPLVQVSSAVCGLQLADIQLHDSRAVGCIQQDIDPPRLQLSDKALERHPKSSRTGYGVDERESGSLGNMAQNYLYNLFLTFDRERYGNNYRLASYPLSNEVYRVPARLI